MLPTRQYGTEVEALTDAAMSGQLPLEEVYGRRLALAQPSRSRVLEVGQMYVDRLVPDTEAPVLPLALERPPSTEPARSVYRRGLSLLDLNLER